MTSRELEDAGTAPLCVSCGARSHQALRPYSFHCAACGTWSSTLVPHIEEGVGQLDEVAREIGLVALRRANFEQILDMLDGDLPAGARLLDVGAAHGWFVEAALARGLRATGIEPDSAVAARAAQRGVPVTVGYFPGDVEPGPYDAITFHDVFEHLPDPAAVLDACRDLLCPGGLLVLNLPNADGIGMRVATTLARLRMTGSIDRFWQVGFPSPHLWYFTRRGLERLVRRHGFDPVRFAALPAVTRDGLWQRLHFDHRPTPFSVVQHAALSTAVPVLNRRRWSDAMVLVLRRGDRP